MRRDKPQNLKNPLDAVVGRLRAKAENYYYEYINQCRRDECLGFDAKVEHGKFGKPELDAHMLAGELLGKHRAFSEAVRMLSEIL